VSEVAEVIAVLPDKIRILINDIDNFQIEGEPLSVGSYLKVYDHQDGCIIAIIENFLIDMQENKEGTPRKNYVVEASPLGFITHEGKFIRGGNQIAIPPRKVEPASNADIQKIYNGIEEASQFIFATLAQDRTIKIPVDGNKFFNKHFAIVGSTGSGKSHTVAKVIQEAINTKDGEYDGLNNSHIVIFDIHAEYATAFPNAQLITVSELTLPYWLLSSEEIEDLFIESNEEQSHNQVAVLKSLVTENKKKHFKGEAAARAKIHYDSPVFFDLNEVFEAIKAKNSEMIDGKNGPKQGALYGKLQNFINRFENKINDVRLDFLLGDKVKKLSTEETIRRLISYVKDLESNITIIDLSGVPFEVLSTTVSLISRLLFDHAYHTKKINPESKNETPLLLIYEEAHKYVPKTNLVKFNASRLALERIAKEGRKYGISLGIVSQRPSEISETIFSQCSNFVAMRLTNPDDQNYVKKLLPDTLGTLTDALSTLQAGEALLIGDASVMPTLVNIGKCSPSPSSNDILYLHEWKKGWKEVNFEQVISNWQR